MIEKTLFYEFMIQRGGTVLLLHQSLLRPRRESDLRVYRTLVKTLITLLSKDYSKNDRIL